MGAAAWGVVVVEREWKGVDDDCEEAEESPPLPLPLWPLLPPLPTTLPSSGAVGLLLGRFAMVYNAITIECRGEIGEMICAGHMWNLKRPPGNP